MSLPKVVEEMLEKRAKEVVEQTGGRYPAWLAELVLLIKGRENQHVPVSKGVGVQAFMHLKIPTNRGPVTFKIHRDTKCDAVNEFIQRVLAGETPEVVLSENRKEKLGLAGETITCLQIYVEKDLKKQR